MESQGRDGVHLQTKKAKCRVRASSRMAPAILPSQLDLSHLHHETALLFSVISDLRIAEFNNFFTLNVITSEHHFTHLASSSLGFHHPTLSWSLPSLLPHLTGHAISFSFAGFPSSNLCQSAR